MIECDPKLCAAGDKCQNQSLSRGERFVLDVKMTKMKGWGLFAGEEIPKNCFIIEYMGELIDRSTFNSRHSRAIANKDECFYFHSLGENLYIDSRTHGNKARFINHSCEPNAKSAKQTVYLKRQEQTRIGIFSLEKIHPVRKN